MPVSRQLLAQLTQAHRALSEARDTFAEALSRRQRALEAARNARRALEEALEDPSLPTGHLEALAARYEALVGSVPAEPDDTVVRNREATVENYIRQIRESL